MNSTPGYIQIEMHIHTRMYEATVPVGAPNQIPPMVYWTYHMCAQWETVQQ